RPPEQPGEGADRARPVVEKDGAAGAGVPETQVGPRVPRPDRRDRSGDDDSQRDLQENRSRTQPARGRDRHRVGDRAGGSVQPPGSFSFVGLATYREGDGWQPGRGSSVQGRPGGNLPLSFGLLWIPTAVPTPTATAAAATATAVLIPRIPPAPAAPPTAPATLPATPPAPSAARAR